MITDKHPRKGEENKGKKKKKERVPAYKDYLLYLLPAYIRSTPLVVLGPSIVDYFDRDLSGL